MKISAFILVFANSAKKMPRREQKRRGFRLVTIDVAREFNRWAGRIGKIAIFVKAALVLWLASAYGLAWESKYVSNPLFLSVFQGHQIQTNQFSD